MSENTDAGSAADPAIVEKAVPEEDQAPTNNPDPIKAEVAKEEADKANAEQAAATAKQTAPKAPEPGAEAEAKVAVVTAAVEPEEIADGGELKELKKSIKA